MRTLDRYIIRSFLYTAVLFFLIIVSLRIVVDMSFNMDEFLKYEDVSGIQKLKNMVSYYAYQTTAYVIELGGIIIVASAAFTLARMNHSNELTAILASGVSLRRVVVPIFVFALMLDAAIIYDQEYVIPSIADKLVRSRDGDLPGKKQVAVRLMADDSGAVWFSSKLDPARRQMDYPLVLVRSTDDLLVGFVSGPRADFARFEGRDGWQFPGVAARVASITRIGGDWIETPDTQRVWTNASPDAMVQRGLPAKTGEPVAVRDGAYGLEIRYKKFEPFPAVEGQTRGGKLIEPRFIFHADKGEMLGIIHGPLASWAEGAQGGYWQIDNGSLFYPTDLKSEDLVLRQSSRWLDYMSSTDLTQLIRMKKVPDLDAALLARHIRFTEPINNIVMLLLGLPFILSRERNIKASASLCLLTVAAFYVFIYICRYMNVEPTVAAWLPILLFGPIAFVMLDSVKT